MMRVGLGYDIHRLVKNRRLYLGGMVIPWNKGEMGHSDGDVLIHALIDALLGAAAMGDIGTHFPPEDPAYKNISSETLLQKTIELISARSYSIVNIDATIILEKPKLLPFVPRIKNSLSRLTRTDASLISLKCKTKEGMGNVGRGKAIEAYVIVLLQ